MDWRVGVELTVGVGWIIEKVSIRKEGSGVEKRGLLEGILIKVYR